MALGVAYNPTGWPPCSLIKVSFEKCPEVQDQHCQVRQAPPRNLNSFCAFSGGPLGLGPLGEAGGSHESEDLGLCLSCHGHRDPTLPHPLLQAAGGSYSRAWSARIKGSIEEACQSWGCQGQKWGLSNKKTESPWASCGEWAVGGWSQLFG